MKDSYEYEIIFSDQLGQYVVAEISLKTKEKIFSTMYALHESFVKKKYIEKNFYDSYKRMIYHVIEKLPELFI